MPSLARVDYRWDRLVRRPPLEFSRETIVQFHRSKIVLVTGAGGSIGSALVQSLLQAGVSKLVALDWSENNLTFLQEEIAEAANGRLVLALGDLRDEGLLAELLQRHRPGIIYHAAAHKHVPLCEVNPFAVIGNNTLGTFSLAKIARNHRVPRLFMVSTDKAANPRSMLGASKRVAEQVLLAMGTPATVMSALRLGNVFVSDGSVVPLFLQQIADGTALTITDPEVTRYFLTMQEATNAILFAGASQANGGILLPDMGEPVRIVDLARHLMTVTGSELPIVYYGLRSGDKLHEDLVSGGESLVATSNSALREIRGPVLKEEEIVSAMEQLDAAVATHDLPALLSTLSRIVPEYQPSAYLQGLASAKTCSPE